MDQNQRAIPAKDLYSAGADALSNGNVLDRYITMKLAHKAGELGGLEPEQRLSGETEGDSDGLLGSREPSWTLGEQGGDGDDIDEFSFWD
jgi:hypothetical protein